MSFWILGAGAVGSFVASCLHRSGLEVVLLLRDQVVIGGKVGQLRTLIDQLDLAGWNGAG